MNSYDTEHPSCAHFEQLRQPVPSVLVQQLRPVIGGGEGQTQVPLQEESVRVCRH